MRTKREWTIGSIAALIAAIAGAIAGAVGQGQFAPPHVVYCDTPEQCGEALPRTPEQ